MSITWAAGLFLVFLAAASLITLPLAWLFRQTRWVWWEFVLPCLPFGLWLGLATWNDAGKSLTNAVVEPAMCGCAAAIPVLMRAFAPRGSRAAYFVGLALQVAAVVAIFFLMPGLPE